MLLALYNLFQRCAIVLVKTKLLEVKENIQVQMLYLSSIFNFKF